MSVSNLSSGIRPGVCTSESRHAAPCEELKTCKRCEQAKPLDQYYKDSRGKGGLFARCKKCHNSSAMNWAKNNRDKVNSIAKTYRDNHKQETAERVSAYYEKNRSSLLVKKKQYRETQKEVISEYQKEWYKRNPQKGSEYAHRRRVRILNGDVRTVTNKDWVSLLNRFDNRCAYCGCREELTKDHVVPISRGGRHSVGNIVPACWKCNMSKGAKFLVEWNQKPSHTL